MVRLRLFKAVFELFCLLRFNPTMVRLRQTLVGRDRAHVNGGFNPTMVRLRRSRFRAVSGPELCFNPTMVRLRLLYHPFHFGPLTLRFNPTMVRLRLDTRRSSNILKPMFQSHYGAIATKAQDGKRGPEQAFQSHYGAIATRNVG